MLGRASYAEAGCHCRGVQDQRCLSLGYFQGREVASLGVPSQWAFFGWLVCRCLCPAHSVAWCFYDGNQQYAQGGRLWFSPHMEEVWRAKYVGQCPPTVAIIAAAPWNQGPGWYSLAEREEGLLTNRSNQPGDDMKDELRTDNEPMLGAPGVLHRTNYGSFVNQLLPLSFLVSKECLLACMLRFERKSKSYRCSLLVVSKTYQIAGERSGSKSMMLLL